MDIACLLYTSITPEAKKTDGITNDLVEIVQPSIEKMIYVIRDKQVMLDSDLAILYPVSYTHLAKGMQKEHIASDVIAKITGLTLAEVESL